MSGPASRGVALVTGGLDRIGGAIAARLAQDGWQLALHCRETCNPAAALAAVLRETGVAWHVFQADLIDPAAPATLIGEVGAHFGQSPTLLVNSASVISEGDWASVTGDALVEHLRVNAIAPVLLIQALAGALRAGETAAAVNLLDQRVRNPPVDQAAYTASKLALAGLTTVLARAFAPAVRVNAVAPGLTLPGDDYAVGQADRLERMMPLDRLPGPGDVADAVAFLARAPAVTGQTLYVDGGAALESYPRDFVHMAREP